MHISSCRELSGHFGECLTHRLLQEYPTPQVMGPVMQAKVGSDFYSMEMRKGTSSRKRGSSLTWSCGTSEKILEDLNITEDNEKALAVDEAKNRESYAKLVQ